MSISAFSPGIAVHEYSHRYTVDEKQKLKTSKLLFIYGIAATILVYGYTRTKSRNQHVKVASGVQLDGHFSRCLPKLLNYGCTDRLTAHQKQK